jgi:hypothetical protein
MTPCSFNTTPLRLKHLAAAATVRNPDSGLTPGTIINVGVIYKVRPGDYLELLAEKFYDTPYNLRLKNPDVPEDGLIHVSTVCLCASMSDCAYIEDSGGKKMSTCTYECFFLLCELVVCMCSFAHA